MDHDNQPPVLITKAAEICVLNGLTAEDLSGIFLPYVKGFLQMTGNGIVAAIYYYDEASLREFCEPPLSIQMDNGFAAMRSHFEKHLT